MTETETMTFTRERVEVVDGQQARVEETVELSHPAVKAFIMDMVNGEFASMSEHAIWEECKDRAERVVIERTLSRGGPV